MDYYVAWGLRGYDAAGDLAGPSAVAAGGLKKAITGRIRATLPRTGCMEICIHTLWPATSADLPAIAKWSETLRGAPGFAHWAHHASIAVLRTASHPVWGGLAREVVRALRESCF